MKKLFAVLLALLSPLALATNSYYVHGSYPISGSAATSAGMRAELDLITAGFNLLPTLAGNAKGIAFINSGASALVTGTATLDALGNGTFLTINGNTITTGTGTLTLGSGITLTATTALTNNGGAGVITWPAAGATLTIPTGGGTLGTGAFTTAYSLPTATSSVLGGVKPDGTTIANSSGAISCGVATSSQAGCVKPDGTTLTNSSGAISVGYAPALSSATTTVNVSSATAPTSGQVLTATGGTAATWQTPASGIGFLVKLATANLNSTADQAITGLPAKYMLTGIYVTNASGSVTTAVGGVYTAASKGGSQIVYAGQAYSALTTSTSLLTTSFAAGALETAYTATTIYLSLTTAQGAAMTADVYVIGVALP